MIHDGLNEKISIYSHSYLFRRKAPTVAVLRSVARYKAGDNEGIPDLDKPQVSAEAGCPKNHQLFLSFLLN